MSQFLFRYQIEKKGIDSWKVFSFFLSFFLGFGMNGLSFHRLIERGAHARRRGECVNRSRTLGRRRPGTHLFPAVSHWQRRLLLLLFVSHLWCIVTPPVYIYYISLGIYIYRYKSNIYRQSSGNVIRSCSSFRRAMLHFCYSGSKKRKKERKKECFLFSIFARRLTSSVLIYTSLMLT